MNTWDNVLVSLKKGEKRLIHIMKDQPYTRTKGLRSVIKACFFCSCEKFNYFKRV